MFNLKTQIEQHIIVAQYCSDAAKGIYSPGFAKLNGHYGESRNVLYKNKDASIIAALKLIDSAPLCGINYYVVREPDQHGNPSNVVYFEGKFADGSRWQISFHGFSRALRFGWAEQSKGRRTHWTHKFGDSRRFALRLFAEL